uniref:RdRp n=1 Tax=Potato latent virus TaxID=138982 RepID=A0A7S8F9J0_9VIRU|nr:RdRp [Potato latent virus]
MALTYRSPLEDIVGAFEPSVQTAIANTAANHYKLLEEEKGILFNYALPPEAKQRLIGAGIYLSPFSAVPHSHPVCKILENHLLYVELPSRLDNSFMFVGIKNFKLDLLKRRHANLSMIQTINRYVCSLDKIRYGSNFVVRSSASYPELCRRKGELDGAVLRELVPELMIKSAKNLFLHDELHYWTHRDLITFLEVLKPDKLLGTLVYPPELLKGAKKSLNSWCYTYRVDKDKLFFYPDGVHSEGYEQPLSGGYLLETSRITTRDGEVYCVDIVCSKFAHHLIAITRGDLIVPTQRSFAPFEAITSKGLNNLVKGKVECFPVCASVVSKLYRYLRTLKKPDEQSAMAKLSQLQANPTGEEIHFIQGFAKLVINTNKIDSLINCDSIKVFMGKLFGPLPNWLTKRLRSVQEVSLDEFVHYFEPYVVNVPTKHVNYGFEFNYVMEDFRYEQGENDLVDMLDNFDGSTKMSTSLCMMTPYVGLAPLTTQRKFLCHIEENSIFRVVSRNIFCSYTNSYKVAVSAEGVVRILEIYSKVSVDLLGAYLGKLLKKTEFIERVRSRVKAIAIKHLKYTWQQVGLAWFTSGRRGYTKYIDCSPYTMNTFKELKERWGVIVRELSKQQNNAEAAKNIPEQEVPTTSKPSSVEKQNYFSNTLMTSFAASGVKGKEQVSSEIAKGRGERSELRATKLMGSCSTLGKVAHIASRKGSMGVLECVARVIKLDFQTALKFLRVKGVWMQEYESIGELEEEQIQSPAYDFCAAIAMTFNVEIELTFPGSDLVYHFAASSTVSCIRLSIWEGVVTLMRAENDCVITACAQALAREPEDVVKVLKDRLEESILEEIWNGEGVPFERMYLFFEALDIQAHCNRDGAQLVLNGGGKLARCFVIKEDHIEFAGEKKVSRVLELQDARTSSKADPELVKEFQKAGTVVEYVAVQSRAQVLAKSLVDATTGVCSSTIFNDCESLERSFRFTESELARNVCCVIGTFGAGKSTLFKDMMKQCLGKGVHYASPRKVLANELKASLGLAKGKRNRKVGTENWNVHTFESFLKKAKNVAEGELVIIDEIQLYPPGYLDLLLYLIPEFTSVFAVGDPCQSDYDNEKDRHVFLGVETDVCRLLSGREYEFNVLSRRFHNLGFEGRLPCRFKFPAGAVKEEYLFVNSMTEANELDSAYKSVYLVSSHLEKKIVEYQSDVKTPSVLTFGESTGCTFKYGCILITQVSSACSERRWITALSRFSHNLCFINATGVPIENVAKSYKDRSLGKFLCGTAVEGDIKSMAYGTPIFKEQFIAGVGRDEGVKEDKVTGDPWLKTMLDLMQLPDVEEAEMMQEEMQEEWFKTHLPQEEIEGVRCRWIHKMLAKEARECRMGSIVSDQFPDDHSKQEGKQITNAAERFEAIYPRHRANDTVTFIMAVKKRLRFSRPSVEKAKLTQAECYGTYLLKNFLDVIKLKPAHDEAMMVRAKEDFEQKKVSKSAATIENHSGRSCRDWCIDIGQIFSKSQICTKWDNRMRVAKAAQTIVCFQHAVLCRFAPYMRYIEMKLKEVLPARFYIHSGKGLDELNSWVKEGRFEGVCTESDYEAFDASQDQYIVAFELALMRYLRLPNDLIEDYKYVKTHLGSKLGNFAIMRFSGEASTFLFNTMANMLFTFMRYELHGDEYICFAGDDMCSSKRLRIKKTHESFLGKLKLKAKVQHTEKPTFCGWNLCADGIYKKPQLVFERMCIAKELNNLHNCIDNYAIEVAFAYKLGELAVNRMDEEELGAFYNCVRLITKFRHLLKSNVVEVFKRK